MKSKLNRQLALGVAVSTLGMFLLLIIWVAVKFGFHISDRYLPNPLAVITAFRDIEPSIFAHTWATVLRLFVGGVVGIGLGIGLAITMYHKPLLGKLLAPSIHALRSIPPVATVPFFLLWFGFEEKGKFLLILFGIGLNVLVAAYQILEDMPDKYKIALVSFGHSPRSFPVTVALPLVVERILPTIRTSLSIAFGVVIVAELLGSQQGLGYLIQTSRSTYAIHVIFLATLILGFLNILTDQLVTRSWQRLVYWNSAFKVWRKK
uniref:Sulfonate transport system permease protein n=1 Tax=Candidatus Kentrum sp. DK TaxID=2126562 RepID=A0A450SFH1_9GAMM|nr:MAG: sulfonate transport system permease protein [Candidatus Kentron sp. DK]